MELQQESVTIDDISRDIGSVASGYGETCDSFDSELHLVSVDNMLSLGEFFILSESEIKYYISIHTISMTCCVQVTECTQ
jgi:hypothetical protein